MSPTGPNSATTLTSLSGSYDAWTISGTSASITDGSGGWQSNGLKANGFSFNLPSYAVIDGIEVSFSASGSNVAISSVSIASGSTSSTSTPSSTGSVNSNPITYGNSTSLWGAAWTPTLINSSNLAVTIYANNTHGGGNISVSGIAITVYWHAGVANVPHRWIYQVFSSTGQFVGSLPNVLTPFQYSQDINTAGTTLPITCGVSVDTAYLPVDDLTDESGNLLTDESTNQLTTEGTIPIASLGTGPQALIQNGNQVVVYEVSYWHPNGKIVFQGEIQRWEASYGGKSDGSGGAATSDPGGESISLIVYSNGQDFGQYMLRGYPYTYTSDVYQSASNVFGTISTFSKGGGFEGFGQTWQAGTTNLGAINLAFLGYANVTVTIYNSPAMTTILGSVTQYVSAPSETTVQFALPTELVTVSGTEYFFTVTVDAGQSISIAYQNTAVYANGTAYYANYSGGSGGSSYYPITGDLYFETFSGTGSTTATFTNVEPVAGILEPILNDYIARGGLIRYDSSTLTPTTLSLSCQFNTNTIYEGIQEVLKLVPSSWYYYVDLGSDTLYFKKANTVADIVFTKDHDLDQVTVIASIENLINSAFFTGGKPSGSTTNIYVAYSDPTSIARYGQRLDRPTDTNVLDQATGYTVAEADVLGNNLEQNQTSITVLYPQVDLTSLKPGMIVGFQGYGTFTDEMLLQIVRIDMFPEQATLTLGTLPPRLLPGFDIVTKGLIGLETLSNPTTPSFSV